MSNGRIPCLHADNRYADCAPGGKVSKRGRVYLIEGTLDNLKKRYEADFGSREPDGCDGALTLADHGPSEAI